MPKEWVDYPQFLAENPYQSYKRRVDELLDEKGEEYLSCAGLALMQIHILNSQSDQVMLSLFFGGEPSRK